MAPISSQGTSNMSWSTNASRSAGESVSRTTSSAGLGSLAEDAVGHCSQIAPVLLEAIR
jgi:hypothetical protein